MTLGMMYSQSLLPVVIRGHSCSLDADGYAVVIKTSSTCIDDMY